MEKPLRSKTDSFIIFYFTLILGIIFAFWILSRGLILSYSDAIYRLSIARSIIDSLEPGLVNIGGIWPPLPQIVMLIFVWNDFLFYSGLAGTIPSLIIFSFSCVLIYKFAYEMFEDKKLSLLSLSIYAANINILYFSSVPMSEIYSSLFLVSSTYYFYKWTIDNKISSLILAGFSVMLGTFVRYDLWPLLLFFVLLIITKFTIIDSKIDFSIKNFIKNLRLNYHKIEGVIIFYAIPAIFGISGWIFYSWIILGDPLYFLNSVYAAGHLDIASSGLVNLPTKYNLSRSILIYSSAVIYMVGPIFLLSIVIFIYMLRRLDMKTLSIFILFTPFIFYIFSLYAGNGTIRVPNFFPYGKWNIRYGLIMLPFVALTIPNIFMIITSKIKKKIIFIIFGILLINYSFLIFDFQPIEDQNAPSIKNLAREINRNYDGGKILVASKIIPWEVMYYSHIPYKEYIILNNNPIWNESINFPSNHSKWILDIELNELERNYLIEDFGKFSEIEAKSYYVKYNIQTINYGKIKLLKIKELNRS